VSTSAIYGSDALRLMRAQQGASTAAPECQPSLLEQIPPDAPMDDATLTVWNGARFVAYDSWLATAPIQCDEHPPNPAYPTNADCIVGECGSTRIRLVKDGDRWLMFTGSSRAYRKRKDFASPFLEHAVRTAEQWYGAPAEGWRLEKKTDETREGDVQ